MACCRARERHNPCPRGDTLGVEGRTVWPAPCRGFLGPPTYSTWLTGGTVLKPAPCRCSQGQRGRGLSQAAWGSRLMGTPWALTAHFAFLIVKERKGQLPQWGGVMANRNLPRLRWKTCIWNGFPRRKQPPLTWNPQAHRVTDVRLELVCVEPGLREAAAEAGVQGFTQKRWQPLEGKQSPGKCSGHFHTQKRAPDFRKDLW